MDSIGMDSKALEKILIKLRLFITYIPGMDKYPATSSMYEISKISSP